MKLGLPGLVSASRGTSIIVRPSSPCGTSVVFRPSVFVEVRTIARLREMR